MVSEHESLSQPAQPAQPPAGPWLPLRATESPHGVFSFYYSEDEAAVAIRAVMLKNNNKSDPNIETATYGLFSTCSQRTRAGIVQRGIRYMFFVTQRGGGRMLTGYYRLKWYTQGNLPGHDFAIAADYVHFIHPGIFLKDLPVSVQSLRTKRFRLSLALDNYSTRTLLDLLNSRPNCVERYLSEIDRLERRNKHLTGFRYVAWRRTEPFTWDAARLYLPSAGSLTLTPHTTLRRKTKSRSGKWRCIVCDRITQSDALLKICPWCQHPDSLVEHIAS